MNNQNRGQPRGRGHYSGGNRRAMRDAQRAYNYNAEQQQLPDWAYEPEAFDPSRVKPKARGPTKRSEAFKAKLKLPVEVQTLVPSTTSTPMRDEPLNVIIYQKCQSTFCSN